MNLETAIQTALQYERRVHGTYREARAGSLDEVGRKVFAALALEEQGHIDYLEARLQEWQRTGHVTPERLDTVVPPAHVIREGVARLGKQMAGAAEHGLEADFLKRALVAEQETSAFYRSLVAELDAVGQALFARFVEIEEGHVAIVQAELDAVTGMGFWFDVPEFRLEAE
jgi:rubrerythrin